MLKGLKKIMTSKMKKAYGLYFNRQVANLDKNYVPNHCCSNCLRYLLGWLKGAQMTLHTYSDTERNSHNYREGVSREGSVSPRGVREAMHGADGSCSLLTVVAERTLPAAGLSPLGWPSSGSYRRAFP